MSYIKHNRMEHIYTTLQRQGFVVVHDYFNQEDISNMIYEATRVLNENSDKIQILDKEGCSNDERIFYAEKYSKLLKTKLYDNTEFMNIVKKYTKCNTLGNRKLLINRLVYEEGKIKNSGAGWHRDNHNLQFKIIIYLSDVTEKNGNFQWITNSSKKHIGFPEPRTKSYNTRFHDHTVKKLLESNTTNKLVNITGKAGTMIIADTTYIHRGNIIQEGSRLAATIYYI